MAFRRKSKFVQINVSSASEHHEEVIYALDDEGIVWYFVDNKWRKIETGREE